MVPALQKLVRSQDNLVARFHALWTLEGLGALDLGLVREQMKDGNPRMRVQAIRASETLFKSGTRALADDYRAMTKDSDADVAIQAMLTANLFRLPDVESLIKETMAASPARGVQEIGQRVLQRIATAATTAAAGFCPGPAGTDEGRGDDLPQPLRDLSRRRRPRRRPSPGRRTDR